MDYSELGAYLKEERERQELSLDDIQQKTKISVSSLEAIEEGRVNDLPHPVYAKGFIKNYAQCLGLNADELAGTFAQKAGIDEEFEDETEHLQSELTPDQGSEQVAIGVHSGVHYAPGGFGLAGVRSFFGSGRAADQSAKRRSIPVH